MYKSCIFRRFSTIFTALFYPYKAHKQTAQNLHFVSSLVALCSYSYWAPSRPKLRFAQERRAIERFQRAICPALKIRNARAWLTFFSLWTWDFIENLFLLFTFFCALFQIFLDLNVRCFLYPYCRAGHIALWNRSIALRSWANLNFGRDGAQ